MQRKEKKEMKRTNKNTREKEKEFDLAIRLIDFHLLIQDWMFISFPSAFIIDCCIVIVNIKNIIFPHKINNYLCY